MFRITFAEFIKVLKKPSIYIMGVVLAIAIIISAFIFKPTNVKSYDLNLNTNSAVESYNSFMSSSGSENKQNYDLNFTKSKNIVEYFTGFNTYKSILKQKYDDILIEFENLKKANTTGEITKINLAYSKFKTAIENFKKHYFDFESFPDDNEFINYLSTSNTFLNCLENNGITKLIKSCDDDPTDNKDSHQIVEFIITNNILQDIEVALNNGLTFTKNAFINLNNILINNYETYKSKINNLGQGFNSDVLIQSKNEMSKLLKEYQTLINLAFENDYPIIYANKNDKLYITEFIEIILEEEKAIFSSSSLKTIEKLSVYSQRLEELKFVSELNKFVKGIKEVSISSTIVTKLNSTIETIKSNQNLLVNEMSTNKSSISNAEMLDLILSYKLLTNISYNYVIDTIILNSTSNLSTTEIKKLYGYEFSSFNEYKLKENIARNGYYINNNTYEDNFLTPFGFNENSGTETNAYDFMYFSLRISVILITIFAIMMISSNITQEQDNGTIKLLLIRPFSRSKILSAKLLSTLFFVVLFIIFASIISFISGLAMFGGTAMNVLCIFNASTVIQMSASSLMFINVLCLIVEVLFFTIVSFALATLFKSYAGSLSTSIIIFILALALNILLGNSIVYTFIPFANIDFFKYFGNSFVYSTSADNIFKSLLCTPIISNMTFWSSFAIYLIITLILIAVSHYVFRRRDF